MEYPIYITHLPLYPVDTSSEKLAKKPLEELVACAYNCKT